MVRQQNSSKWYRMNDQPQRYTLCPIPFPLFQVASIIFHLCSTCWEVTTQVRMNKGCAQLLCASTTCCLQVHPFSSGKPFSVSQLFLKSMSFPLNIFLLYAKLSYVYMSIARLLKSCLTFCFAVVTVLSFLGHITLQPPFFLLLLPLPTGLLFMQSCLQKEFFFLDVLLLGLGFRLSNIQEEEKGEGLGF